MGTSQGHSINWKSYKRHRILLVCLFLLFIPLTRLVSLLAARLNLPAPYCQTLAKRPAVSAMLWKDGRQTPK